MLGVVRSFLPRLGEGGCLSPEGGDREGGCWRGFEQRWALSSLGSVDLPEGCLLGVVFGVVFGVVGGVVRNGEAGEWLWRGEDEGRERDRECVCVCVCVERRTEGERR